MLFGAQPESRTSSDIFGHLRTIGTQCIECDPVVGVESDVVRIESEVAGFGPRQFGLRRAARNLMDA
jgi:hypothetical protein